MTRLYNASGEVIGGECGVLDRFAGPCQWPHRRITYFEAMAFAGMDRAAIADAYDRAWRQWADVCGIEPVRLQQAAGANVLARAGRIGFRGGVLAWSQIPCGSVSERAQMAQKYDTAERWSPTFLLAVACHECGHALGLSHLGRGNLMYRSITRITKPQPGDIAAVVARYGPPRSQPEPPAPQPPPPPVDPDEPPPWPPAPVPPEPVPVMTDSLELAHLLAAHRKGHILEVDPRLEALAREIAEDNARRDRISHVDARGRWPHERARAAGVANYHGEVLAAGGPEGVKGLVPMPAAYAALPNAADLTAWPWLLTEVGLPGVPAVKTGAFDAWRQSEGHWRTLIDPAARSIGAAVVEVEGGAWRYFDGKTRYWAAVTGT